MSQTTKQLTRSKCLRLAGLAAVVAAAISTYAIAGRMEDSPASYNGGGFAASVESLERLAARGSVPAQLTLGQMYADGQGVSQNYNQAAKWLAMAASHGEEGGKVLLIGVCTRAPAPPAECQSLVAEIKEAAAHGEPQAQVELGNFYLAGDIGFPKDQAAAIGWLRKAADQGYVRAQYQLGLIYGAGQFGVSADPAQAISWFHKAADQGDAESMRTLAAAYQDGSNGVAKDPTLAFAWRLRAANAGEVSSQIAVAAMYADGEGVAVDPVQSVHWYRKAAEHGDANAAADLAGAYASGKGAARDDVAAYAWMDAAIDMAGPKLGGAPDYWVVAFDKFRARLTGAQVVEATAKAAELKAELIEHNLTENPALEDKPASKAANGG